MNQDELIEKCRLTDEEVGDVYYPSITPQKYGHRVAQAQLRKAIPIIEAEARKAERERIISLVRQITPVRPLDGVLYYDVRFTATDWQALKGEGNE